MKLRLTLMLLSAIALVSCGTKKSATDSNESASADLKQNINSNQEISANQNVNIVNIDPQTEPVCTAESAANALAPKAVAFRANGDYANNVMICLASDGTIAYYPATSDIKSDSSSLPLGDGWLLNRQCSATTGVAFLTYTYEQYAALSQTPTIAELKSAIIPGAQVIETCTLPVSVSEAKANPAALKQYLNVPQQTITIQQITE